MAEDRINAAAPHREHAVDLSVGGWALALVEATWITSGLAWKAAKGLLPQTRKDGSSWHEYVAYHGLRDYQSRLSPVRIQNLCSSTAKICRRFAKRHRIPCTMLNLPYGTVAHRLGKQTATRHVVFFHGGGYMAPALSSHIDFASGFANPPREDVALHVLQYSLVSEGANQYPCQLQQATTLLDHLIRTENIPPSSIILVGDSAGGHLLVSLMLHIRHPHPQVTPLKFEDDLAGAVIVSPWLNLHESPDMMRRCERPDMLDTKALAYWANSFLAGAPTDSWNDPLKAPVEWWSDLPVGDIFLTFGSDELLHDGDAKLGDILQQHHHGSTTVMRCVGELHDHMIMNRFLALNKPCESEEGYKNFLQGCTRAM